MNISAQQPCGTILNFHLNGRWGVYRLKARIQSATKIAMDQQKLILAGIVLRHDQTLTQAGLHDQDVSNSLSHVQLCLLMQLLSL